MNNQNIEVSVVMPCLNEQEAVGICVRKAKKALDDLGIQGEIIVVDNGSKDDSAEMLKKVRSSEFIVHSQNIKLDIIFYCVVQ